MWRTIEQTYWGASCDPAYRSYPAESWEINLCVCLSFESCRLSVRRSHEESNTYFDSNDTDNSKLITFGRNVCLRITWVIVFCRWEHLDDGLRCKVYDVCKAPERLSMTSINWPNTAYRIHRSSHSKSLPVCFLYRRSNSFIMVPLFKALSDVIQPTCIDFS